VKGANGIAVATLLTLTALLPTVNVMSSPSARVIATKRVPGCHAMCAAT